MDRFDHDGLTFDVTDTGPPGGRAVIALHGFPEDRHCWTALAAQLVAAGHRVLAPDQRGYSPGARPAGRRAYAVDRLEGDVLALAAAAGLDRFDVIGHDWGSVVAWALAARHGDRIRTLTSLSVPHPSTVREAALHSTQLLHSWYMLFFQLPGVPEAAMARVGADRAADRLVRDGLDPASARRYAERMADPASITGPIRWYRALPWSARTAIPPVEVPTLYLWGDGDHYLTRYAAERSARHVTGPYRFEVLAGASHWLPTTAADRVGPLVLDHLASAG